MGNADELYIRAGVTIRVPQDLGSLDEIMPMVQATTKAAADDTAAQFKDAILEKYPHLNVA